MLDRFRLLFSLSSALQDIQYRHPEVIAEVRARMERLLATFESQLTEVESEIAAALSQDSAWAAAATRLQSIKGVGWVTAAWTLVSALNFTSCDTADSLTAYAGLAPMPRQSGSSVWHRPAIGHTGNGRLRTAFYMATLNAAQHNPVIKAFYTRLRVITNQVEHNVKTRLTKARKAA